jgi:hypothetical protein
MVPVGSAEAAELVKVYENTFRMINIALANELAQGCEKLGTDVWGVIGAAAIKPFGFMKFAPGTGLGGHCIPLDPHYLGKMRALACKTRMIDLPERDQHRDAGEGVVGGEWSRCSCHSPLTIHAFRPLPASSAAASTTFSTVIPSSE